MDIQKQIEILNKHANNVPLEYRGDGPAYLWKPVPKQHVFNFQYEYRESPEVVVAYVFVFRDSYGLLCTSSKMQYGDIVTYRDSLIKAGRKCSEILAVKMEI